MVLGYAILFLYFIVPVLVAVACVYFVWGSAQSPFVGLALILGTFLLDTWTNSYFALRLGLWVYPQDAALLLIGIATALRLTNSERLARIPAALLALFALLICQFALGTLKFKTTAGVDFRQDYYFLMGAAYFASFDLEELQLPKLRRYWMATAAILIPIIVFRWAVDTLGLDVPRTWAEPGRIPLRVINAAQTLFMAQAFAMGMWGVVSGVATAFGYVMVPTFGAFIIVLQHRSVWAVAAVALALSITLGRRGALAGVGVGLAILIAVGLLVKGASSGTGVEAAVAIQRAAATASTEQGTFRARISGWGMALTEWSNASTVKQILGQPYGGGYGIQFLTNKGKATFFPHNYYIQVLLRGGLIGVALLAFIYLQTGYRLLRSAVQHSDKWAGLFALLLATQLVFFIPYGSPFTQGIVLGTALAVARAARAKWTSTAEGKGQGTWAALPS